MFHRFALAAAVALATIAGSTPAQPARAEEATLLNANFSFNGIFGTYDPAALQRGLQIYTEVCSNCHGLVQLSYRNLAALGYTPDQIKAYAAQKQVPSTDDAGQPIMVPAKPSDKFVGPFPNDKAARAANNGALPPNLALITKAREGGGNYVYSLMQGYKDPPPAGVTIANGMYYNEYFPGHQIAMPPPLTDAAVTYADGTPNNLRQEASDIATFLTWAAEPEMEQRKQLGVKVMLFLLVLTGLLYGVKRLVWADVH
jgi:cytochrome c1